MPLEEEVSGDESAGSRTSSLFNNQVVDLLLQLRRMDLKVVMFWL